MNTRAVKRLKWKFILTSMLTFAMVMLMVGFSINLATRIVSGIEIRRTLEYLVEAEGDPFHEEGRSDSGAELSDFYPEGYSQNDMFAVRTGGDGAESALGKDSAETESRSAEAYAQGSGTDERDGETDEPDSETDMPDGGDNGSMYYYPEIFERLYPEFQYSARYFTVIFEEDGESLSEVHTRHIVQISSDEAVAMAQDAVARSGGTGFGETGHFCWKTAVMEDGRIIAAFLNCRAQINSNNRLLNLTLLMSVLCLVVTFVLVCLLSNRIIRPEIENLQKQKQFITNASHELKTPLAVIRANTEIEEMMNGESEWTQSTMRQVDRLNGLVQNLVMIARAQEQEDRSVMTEIDVSRCVTETVTPYESLAQQNHMELIVDVPPDISLIADESKIRQLASLLVDNAFKYCDEKGRVAVSLASVRKGKIVKLMVSNSYAEGANVDYSRFFDRFYREDKAHNVDRGGYGIGLSIAESICQQYGGSIDVSWKDGVITFTCHLV